MNLSSENIPWFMENLWLKDGIKMRNRLPLWAMMNMCAKLLQKTLCILLPEKGKMFPLVE